MSRTPNRSGRRTCQECAPHALRPPPSPALPGWAAIPVVAFVWRVALALALCGIVMLALALLVASTTGGCGGASHVADALRDLAGRVCVGTDSVQVCVEKCRKAAEVVADGGEGGR